MLGFSASALCLDLRSREDSCAIESLYISLKKAILYRFPACPVARKGYGVASCMNTLPETSEEAGSLICKRTRAPDSALTESTREISLNANRALTTE